MTVARCFLGGATDRAGHVWALGGGSSLWQHAQCFRSTEFLDPNVRPPPATRAAAAAAAMYNDDDDDDDDDDGPFGGSDDDCPVGAWATGPMMRAARCGLGAATSFDTLYVVGGYGGGSTYHASCEALDLGSPEWRRCGDMSVARTGCGGCPASRNSPDPTSGTLGFTTAHLSFWALLVFNGDVGVAMGPDGCVYVTGGSPDGSKAHRSCERLDPREGVWRLLAPMSVGRGYCAASFVLSGTLLVSGGISRDGTELASIESFDPAAGRWRVVAASPHSCIPRADHASLYVDLPDTLV